MYLWVTTGGNFHIPLKKVPGFVLQCRCTGVLVIPSQNSTAMHKPCDICKKKNKRGCQALQLSTSISSITSSFSAGGDVGVAPLPLFADFAPSSFAMAAALSCVDLIQSWMDSGGPPSIRMGLSSAGIPRTVPWYRDSSPVLLCFFFSAALVSGQLPPQHEKEWQHEAYPSNNPPSRRSHRRRHRGPCRPAQHRAPGPRCA